MLELLGNGIVVLGFVLTGVAVIVSITGLIIKTTRRFKKKNS